MLAVNAMALISRDHMINDAYVGREPYGINI